MIPKASVDKAIRSLMETCSITQKNSELSAREYGTPHSKVMFKIPWVFSKTPGLAHNGINCVQELIKYLKAHPQIYICYGNCVLTLDIWNRMPNEYDTFIEFTELFRSQSCHTILHLKAAIQKSKTLPIRLRNKTTIQEYLTQYSDFFMAENQNSVKTTVPFHLDAEQKIESMDVMLSIQRFIQKNKETCLSSIDLTLMLKYLNELGYRFKRQELEEFLAKFNSNFQPPIDEVLQPSLSSNTLELVHKKLKRWPIQINTILRECNKEGLTLNNEKLKSIIKTDFSDFKIQDGLVVKDHDLHKDLVQNLLDQHCPISVSKLRQIISQQGITLSIKCLNEMVVKTLDNYSILKGQILLPTSTTSNGRPMKDCILNILDLPMKEKGRVSLNELRIYLASKGILITKKKMAIIIKEYSSIYECKGNFVELKTIDSQDVKEFLSHLKSLNMDKENSILDSKERRIFKKAFLDEVFGKFYQNICFE